MIVVSRQIGFVRGETRRTSWVRHEVPERIARRHWLEGLRVDLIGAPAEEERIDALHPLKEGHPDVVMPVRDGPAAVGEAPVAILILASRGLDHAIEAHELVHNQLSHTGSL
jgi:hypothetical protein